VVDGLEVERVVDAAPRVQIVVSFDDVFATVVQFAVTEQETEATVGQVVLVVFLDGIADEGHAQLVVGAGPSASGVVAAERDGLIDLGVGEGLVLALVPADAGEGAEVPGHFLLGVEGEAVLYGAELPVCDDVGLGILSGEEGIYGVTIEAHVGMVDEAEHADGAFAVGGDEWTEQRFTELELHILSTGAADGPVEVDAVGGGGHGGETVAGGPVFVVVFKDAGVGVAAGIGGVVPGSVVVDGPIEELEVAVGADGVDVEVVGEAHLAEVELEATLGNLRSQSERCAFAFDELVGEAEGLVNLNAGDVGLRAEVWVADDVEVGEAGETERLADAAAAGGFNVQDGVGVVPGVAVDLRSEEERSEQGSLVFASALEAVDSFVGRVEGAVALQDDIGLPGRQKAGGFRVRKDGQGWVCLWCRWFGRSRGFAWMRIFREQILAIASERKSKKKESGQRLHRVLGHSG